MADVFEAWHRVLVAGGQLIVALWGGQWCSRLRWVFRHYGAAVPGMRLTWAEAVGFVVSKCATEPVDEMAMDAMYLEARKAYD